MNECKNEWMSECSYFNYFNNCAIEPLPPLPLGSQLRQASLGNKTSCLYSSTGFKLLDFPIPSPTIANHHSPSISGHVVHITTPRSGAVRESMGGWKESRRLGHSIGSKIFMRECPRRTFITHANIGSLSSLFPCILPLNSGAGLRPMELLDLIIAVQYSRLLHSADF